MAYTALYRKFRPIKFSEMVGQEHITKTLKNQITANRIGHAYLFSGGRGTGKTSAAKIMARAINCLNPKEDGEPCNECEICKAILEGSLTDVVEMDAASNNSVEDIRLIRDEVNFLPTVAKYRVYIIDEVHMLSTGAFNALLKTLEEPPEHVKFILATTEPQKLPATILSRCQRFDFKRINALDISKRLKIICKESNIEITDEAIKMIAILAEGALRDGISILERCSQDTEGVIDEDKIRDLVGMPKLTYIKEVVKNMIEENAEGAIETTNTVIDEGKDLDNFLWEVIKYIKDTLIYKTTKKLELYSKEDIEFINDLAEQTTKERLLSLIYELSELSNSMKISTQKNIIFQTGIIRRMSETRGRNSEDRGQNSAVGGKKAETDNRKKEVQNRKIENEIQNTEKPMQEPIASPHKSNIKTPTSGTTLPYWKNVLDKIRQSGKMTVYANLIGTKGVLINDLLVGIEFPGKVTDFARKVIEDHDNKSMIEKIVSMEHGSPMQIRIIDKTVHQEKTDPKDGIESLANEMDLPFNVIDE